jgi:type I restriction enzyme R subunit
MSPRLSESTLESDALGWLSAIGWQVRHGFEIAPDGLFAEREDYRDLVLKRRLCVRWFG